MRKFLTFSFVICLVASVFAGNKTNRPLEIQITSLVDADIVQVFRVERGVKKLVDEFPLKINESRIFRDTLDHAFYIVMYNKIKRKVYGQENETVKLKVTGSSIDLHKADKANKLLQSWFDLSFEARSFSVNYNHVDTKEFVKKTPFYERQRALEKASVNFHKKIDKYKGDAYFKRAMHKLVDTEITYFKLFFMQVPLLGYYDKAELPEDLYGSIPNNERFADPVLLDVSEELLPYGQLYGWWRQYKDHANAKYIIGYFSSPEIKVAYLLGHAELDKSGESVERIEKKYMHLLTSEESIKQFKKLQEQFAYLKDPSKMPDFKFQNLQDEIVPLSNYHGKLIVIDVWASWCAPCMKARPNFEALAEEMKDEDVTFIGVSVDQSDLKWKKVAAESHCVELRDKDKTFSNAFGLSTIPRYMIFSKDGGALVQSAPSPNTPDLKKTILKYLTKNNKF
ncbi:TlpA family protein disulfide reductase [Aestuariibaculum marinum]|uniref:TlpA family protein disulfide reductase n=1 Tax=Aestuariibaculum marinum TaxID=2683592 RepID=A0A8J6Q3N1_9FLAO|nr:TlpA disulfide reductase family protein [Aestuariibaculum marinum]MBD0824955.1 TlpA family protein disulfide reductase [Aestuariibaculum marinum]